MEQIIYPTEHKTNTIERVLIVVTKIDGNDAWQLYLRKLSDEKLFKLLKDVIKEGE